MPKSREPSSSRCFDGKFGERPPMRRIILGIATLASIVLATAPSGLAQGYPTRPVRVITLTAAGGSLDIIARTLAQSLTETMGQQFYVENKVGAGGNLGVAELGRSA